MKIFIYSYKNKTTGNRYIGKTNNIERRKREHISGAYNPDSVVYNSMWSKKIREYGIESFDFEILETADETNWSEREQYWIEKYNTFNGRGYNSTAGGDSNQHLIKSLNDEEAQEVRGMLKSNISSSTIQALYDISATLVSNINQGKKYIDYNITYPIQQFYKEDQEYLDLINDLKNGTDSFLKLSKKYNIGESTVKKINYGILRPNMMESYPIRKISGVTQKANVVKNLLIYSEQPFNEIAILADVSLATVKRINQGKTHYDKELSYPLRKPVSTIV